MSEDSRADELYLRWVAGVSLAMMNCAMSSIGFVMQRKAHLHDGEPWSNKLWAAGVAVYVAAALPDVVAYMLVPQVVCTAVQCFRMVVVTMMADLLLGEKVKSLEIVGMLTCSVGTFLCLQFGPRPDEEHINEHVLEGGEAQLRLSAYMLIGLTVLAVLLFLECCGRAGSEPGAAIHYFSLPVATGLAFALEKVFNTEIGMQLHGRSIQQSLGQPSVLVMLVMIASLGLLDFALNLRGAKMLPVPAFVPVQFAVGTLVQYFQSMYIFGEFSRLPQLQAALSLLGAAMALVGAVLIRPPALSPLCLCSSPCGAYDEMDSDSDGESDSDDEVSLKPK